MLKWITILRLQYRLTVLEIYLILKKKFKIFFSLYVYFLASRKQANFVCTRYSIHKKLLFEKIYINTGSEWQEHRLLYFFYRFDCRSNVKNNATCLFIFAFYVGLFLLLLFIWHNVEMNKKHMFVNICILIPMLLSYPVIKS